MSNIDLDKSGRLPQNTRVYLGPSVGWKYIDKPVDIEYVITSGSTAVTNGYKGSLTIPNWLVINNWVMLSDVQGTVSVDVWKVSLATFLASGPPTVANSITGTDIPTLTNAYAATSSALTGWTTIINQNDVLGFNVPTPAVGVARITLILRCVTIIGQG